MNPTALTFAEHIAIRTLWSEARGEPDEGQRAVAHVLVNRLKDGRWGPTFASVCLASSQFSCWNTTDPNRKAVALLPDADPMLAQLAGFMAQAIAGDTDPTGGATHYYATSMKTAPFWAKGKPFIRIGRHLFFKDIK